MNTLANSPSRVADGRRARPGAGHFPLLPQAAEEMALGMVISDATRADNPIVYCNPGFEQLTGYTADEIVGRNCRFLQGPDTDGRELDTLRQALRARRGCAVVLRNYRKDGTAFWNALTVTPLADAGGTVTHFVGVQTDITAVKELEDQLRQAQKMEVVGRLTGSVAHDFNNLLTVITGFTETALDGLPAGDPARAMLTEVAAAGTRAAGLTRQLLAFSRKSGPARASADLNAVVAGCEGLLRRLLGRAVELVVEPPPALRPVAVDPGQVEQVLMNLVVNARDAMPGGGRVTVAMSGVRIVAPDPAHPGVSPGVYALLRVSDTGCGMDAATQARVFEPFFTTKPAGRGTGLGLATVTDIARGCGGHVRLESEVGRGTAFFVYLPKATFVAGGGANTPDEARVRGSEVVLVADDDDAVRAVMALALRARGYTVLEAADAADALRVARAHPGPVHLAVCDVFMPGGSEPFAELQAANPGLRTLLVSGYAPDAEAGPVPFLAKPFTPPALARKVRQVLDAPAPV